MVRRKLAAVLALALAPWLASCGTRKPIEGQETTGLDRKYSTFAWIEQGDLVTLIVGTRAARYRENSEFMPLEIAIANNGVKTLVLTRESFVLIDEEGNRYPAAAPRELLEGYDFLDLDRDQLAELGSIVGSKFAAFTQYNSKFSPTRSAAMDLAPGGTKTVRDMVSLPRYGYLIDYIYFPRPATGILDRRFELFVESQNLPDPVFVRFKVE
jgi:hypothetical protein